MNSASHAMVGMMKLLLGGSPEPALLERAAQVIRTLDHVLRVRTDARRAELEIVYTQPAPELLRRIHEALLLARQEPATR